MRIDDVFVLFPELRPQPRILQDVAGNSPKRIPSRDDMNLEVFRIGRILIRADVTIRPNRQIFRRRSLRRRGLRGSLSKCNRSDDQCCG